MVKGFLSGARGDNLRCVGNWVCRRNGGVREIVKWVIRKEVEGIVREDGLATERHGGRSKRSNGTSWMCS